MSNHRMSVFSVLMTGIGAGLLMGGLFAPRTGKESRKLLSKRAKRVKRVVRDAVDDGSRYITRSSAKVRDQATDLVKRGKVIYRTAERTAGKMVHAVL